MVVTDPIADLLTRIRNALVANHEVVYVPMSKEKKSIVDILVNEGYISDAEVVEIEDKKTIGKKTVKKYPAIKITLKYGPKKEKIITNLRRISKPGLRVYCKCGDLPVVLNGMGIAIISTPKGIMTDKLARANNVGGEVLAYVY